MYQQLPLLERRDYVSDNARNMCINLRNRNRLRFFKKIGDCNLLGRGQIYTL